MDTIGAAFAVLRTGVRFNRKADRGTGGGSQAQAPVTKSASAPALDFFGKQKGTAKRKISEEEEKSSGNGKKVKKGAQGRGGQDAAEDMQVFSRDASPGEVSTNEDSSDDERARERKHKEKIALRRVDKRIHVNGKDIPDPVTSFEQLGRRKTVNPALLRNVTEAGYVTPTPIQMQAIPILLQGREVLACAPTGSGKTVAYMLPILESLKGPQKVGFRALVLAPTRELAKQIHSETEKLARGMRLKAHCLTKATASSNSFGPQSSQKFDILVATPMRLVGMIKSDSIKLNNVEWLIMDEADKLWEMGFLEQIDEIVASCSNPKITRALFSATLPPNVEEMARTILRDPINVTIGEKNAATDTIKQSLMFVGREDGKLLAVRQMIQQGIRPPVLIFVQSVDRAKELFHELVFDNINVDVIHSERTQAQRENVIKKFRMGEIWILVATDLLGRGMDFKGVNLVVNYDFPQSPADYIHRIGRTGRAGRAGEAVTFFTNRDRVNLRSIVNVMRESGCEVPEWMLEIPKSNKSVLRKLRKQPLGRKSITTASKYDKEKVTRRKQAIEASKKQSRGESTAEHPA